jgi:cytidine deaminase
VTGANVPTPPCGACRQILWEFAGDVPVVSVTEGGQRKLYRMADLLPEPFEF